MATKTANTLHKAPTAVDEMSKDEFDSMMAKGLAQAKANESRPASDVLSEICKYVHLAPSNYPLETCAARRTSKKARPVQFLNIGLAFFLLILISLS